MTKLLDYSFARPDPAQIKAAGFSGVLRYLAPLNEGGKILTRGEVDALQAVGLAIGLVWESYANRALEGASAGSEDATEALRQANALGFPQSVPIFFAVDFDASPEQQASINAYFDGVSSVIGLDRTGIYGGYWPLSRAFDASKVKWGWQTYAWSGGNWDDRAQLRQISNGEWDGQVDFDEGDLAALWVINQEEEMYQGKTAEQWFNEAQTAQQSAITATKIATDRDGYLREIAKQLNLEPDVVEQPQVSEMLLDIQTIQNQLESAESRVSSSITQLVDKDNQIADLKRQLGASGGPSFLDRLAKYNKAWVALAGVLVSILTSLLGAGNPIVQGVIEALAAVGVLVVSNKKS